MTVNADRMLSRRGFLAGTTSVAAALALPGVALAAEPGEPVQRLLMLATRTALGRLAAPNGFLTSPVARFGLPVLFRKSAANTAGPLGQPGFRDQLQQRINILAEAGARGAAPVMIEAARKIVVTDPVMILRGTSTAATSHFRLAMGSELVNAMRPALEQALAAAQDPIVAQAVAALAGVSQRDVAHAVALAADNGIWYEIGRAEAEIRENPAATGDAALVTALRSAASLTPAPATSPAP